MEYKVSVLLLSFYGGELIITQESTEREGSSRSSLVVGNGSGNSANGRLIQTFDPTVRLLTLNRKLPPFLDLYKVQLVLGMIITTAKSRMLSLRYSWVM
jgi:hypothetical protein